MQERIRELLANHPEEAAVLFEAISDLVHDEWHRARHDAGFIIATAKDVLPALLERIKG